MMLDDDGAVYAVRDGNMRFVGFSSPEQPIKICGNIAQFISSILTSSVKYNCGGWEPNMKFVLRNPYSFTFHNGSITVSMEDGDV